MNHVPSPSPSNADLPIRYSYGIHRQLCLHWYIKSLRIMELTRLSPNLSQYIKQVRFCLLRPLYNY